MAAPGMRRRPEPPQEPVPAALDGFSARQLQVYYRSVREGRTWCESPLSNEVAARSLPSDTFEKLVRWEVSAGYEPWTPDPAVVGTRLPGSEQD